MQSWGGNIRQGLRRWNNTWGILPSLLQHAEILTSSVRLPQPDSVIYSHMLRHLPLSQFCHPSPCNMPLLVKGVYVAVLTNSNSYGKVHVCVGGGLGGGAIEGRAATTLSCTYHMMFPPTICCNLPATLHSASTTLHISPIKHAYYTFNKTQRHLSSPSVCAVCSMVCSWDPE